MAARVLVADSSASFRRPVSAYLRRHGFDVFEARSVAAARRLLPAVQPCVMLIDPQLDEGAGATLINDASGAGVAAIVVSACETPDDCASYLQMGAEDCMPRMTDPAEALARIRRVATLAAPAQARPGVQFAAFRLDLATRRVFYSAGGSALLSPSEYALARLLMDAGDGVVSREAIRRHVFGAALNPKSRAVDVLVSKLRRKLDPTNAASPIWSIRGEGYRFKAWPPAMYRAVHV